MTTNINLALKSDQSSLGKIKIAPRVLEIIVSIAAVKIKGVNRMQSSLATSVNELLGHRELGKGIKLAFDRQHRLIVDIYVYINYGFSVPQVAVQIQDKVKQQLLFMTGLKIGAVNVHVNGIVPQKKAAQVDSRQLFHEDGKGDRH